MKKATTIPELAQKLYITPVNIEDKEFYIEDIYKDKLLELRDNIINDDIYSEFYLVGQSGTGKTTALNFLANEKINEKYKLLHLNYKDLIDLADVDFIDIIILLCFHLTKVEKKLEKKFSDKLKEIHKIHDERLETYKEIEKGSEMESSIRAQTKIGLDFLAYIKLGLSAFADYRLNRNVRKVTREFFKVNDMQIVHLANEMIAYYEEIRQDNKQLLVVFDDLDKIRDAEALNNIFLRANYNFNSIKCKKIIAIPVHLSTEPMFKGDEDNIPLILNLKIEKNPLAYSNDIEKQENEITKNKELLKSVFWARCNNKKIIEQEAIEKAIEFSGGILRQYIRILRDSAKQARRLGADKISLNDVEEVVAKMRNYWSRSLISKRIKDYEEISKTHKSGNVEHSALIDAMLANHIIAHSNNDIWYDINPLLKKSLINYTTEQ